MPLTPRQLEAKQNYDRGFRDGQKSQVKIPTDTMEQEIPMAAYVCLNCGELVRSDEDCCDAPDPFPVNDMPAEIKSLREENARLRAGPIPKPDRTGLCGRFRGDEHSGRNVTGQSTNT